MYIFKMDCRMRGSPQASRAVLVAFVVALIHKQFNIILIYTYIESIYIYAYKIIMLVWYLTSIRALVLHSFKE